MDLRAHLASAPRGERGRIAKSLGTSPAYISQIASGFRVASVELAARIAAATAGAVTVEELRPDIDWAVIRGEPATPTAEAA